MNQRMDDMVPRERRTVRDIPIERVKRPHVGTAPSSTDAPESVPSSDEKAGASVPPPTPPAAPLSRRDHKPWGVWGFAALVVLIIIGIGASVLFAGATVTVTPRTQSFQIDTTAPASQEPTVGALYYETVTVTDEVSETVPATGEEFVETRASGQIIIYNTFSSAPQQLVENTRFQTEDGLVYRIRDDVVVPGMEGSGDDATPGSLEVTVYADEPGADYNIGLTDFTIPGFEGQPQFFKFFARSKTPMVGGFSGTQKVVDPTEAETVRATLRESLRAQLRDLAGGKVPTGSFIVEGSEQVAFESVVAEAREDAPADEATLTERGTLTAYVVDRATLASFVAEQSIGTYDGAPVVIQDQATMNVTISPAAGTSSSATVAFRGDGTLEWTFDSVRLAEEFAGKRKNEAQMVLASYPAIDDAVINLRPFWKRSFPNNPERITIAVAEGLTE